MKKSTTFVFLVLFVFVGTTERSYGYEKENDKFESLKSQITSLYDNESYGDSLLRSFELLTLSQQENDIPSEVFAYKSIAECYAVLGEYEKALHQFKNAIQLMSPHYNQSLLAALYTSMSKLLIDLRRLDEAFEMVEKGLPLVNIDEDTEIFFSLTYNHATILMLTGKHSEALTIYTQMGELAEKMGDIRRFAEVKNNIGMLQKFEHDYTKAIKTYNFLLNYAKSHNLQQIQVYSLLELGDINRMLKRFNQSRKYLKQIDILLDNDSSLDWRLFQLSYLLALEQDAKNIALASEYQSKLNVLKPKLSNFKMLNRLELMKTNLNVIEYKNKVSLLEKDKQLKVKDVELQKRKQRNMLLISSILILSVLVFAFYQNRRRHTANLVSQLQAKTITDKNKLLADVSHELRTPLTVLKLQVESLQNNLDDDVEASYQALDDKLSDIGRLISDIYQLAKSDTGVLELNLCDVEFPEAINNWEKEIELLVTSNGFTWNFENNIQDPVIINADSDRIKQVLFNLINNSIKYTDKPGSLLLSTDSSKSELFITIEDSSPSVPNELQSQIFERLYRVEESRSRKTGGSGLGLAICKSLIEAHHGVITANTSQLGGLKITIQLPLS